MYIWLVKGRNEGRPYTMYVVFDRHHSMAEANRIIRKRADEANYGWPDLFTVEEVEFLAKTDWPYHQCGDSPVSQRG